MLITGASGFIGRHVLEDLGDSCRIFAVARGPAGAAGVPSHPNTEWLQADIADSADGTRLLERLQAAGGIDFVLHLAAYYDFTGQDAPEYLRTNVNGLRNVLEIARELRPQRFVYSSSVAACDFTPPGQTIDESTSPEGPSCYARSKRAGEEMLREYRNELRYCIIRFAALFSDWCEYEPLFFFLSRWLSPGWRSRILAGRGESAIPYLHVHDAVALIRRVLERHRELANGETLVASTDGATSHRELHAAATACHFGQRKRAFLMPRLACRTGLRIMSGVGAITGRQPFERPWMGQCIDQKLFVDAGWTRGRLDWCPTKRLEILRRMPFLIQNRKTYLDEWMRRNHAAARRVRLRHSTRLQSLIANHENEICRRFGEHLRSGDNPERFSAYLDGPPDQIEERHHLILGQLVCAIRTGDEGVFMNCCRHLAERWHGQGLPLEQLWKALERLGEVCVATLHESPGSSGLEASLRDQVTMTFQFAVDAVQEVHERHTASLERLRRPAPIP